MSASSQIQQTNPVTPPPAIPLTLDYQCAHGVRVCNGCRNLSNGESEVHGKVSNDMHRCGDLKVQGAKIDHQYLSNGDSEVSGKGGHQIPIKISQISASSLLPAKNGSRSVTVGSNKKMTSPVKASVM